MANWEKTFTMYVTHRRLIFLIYKELFTNWENRKLTKNDIKIACKHMEIFPTLLTIKEIQIKTTKMPVLPIALAKIWMLSTYYCVEVVEKQTL